MKSRYPWLILAFGVIAILGCASYPLGLSKSQWNSLTPQEQADYRKRDAVKAQRDGREMREQAASAVHEAESLSKLRSSQDNNPYSIGR
jgi:hypothetical protein